MDDTIIAARRACVQAGLATWLPVPASHVLVQDAQGTQCQPITPKTPDWRLWVVHQGHGGLQGHGEHLHAGIDRFRAGRWQRHQDLRVGIAPDAAGGEQTLILGVHELIAVLSAHPPLARWRWQVDDHDPDKRQLYNHDQRVTSIWRMPSGRAWGTCGGDSFPSETAARTAVLARAMMDLIDSRRDQFARLRLCDADTPAARAACRPG